VDLLVTRERGKLLDTRLHVMAVHPFALGDAGQIDIIDHGLVRLDDAVGQRNAEIALRPEDRDPQPPLGPDLLLG